MTPSILCSLVATINKFETETGLKPLLIKITASQYANLLAEMERQTMAGYKTTSNNSKAITLYGVEIVSG